MPHLDRIKSVRAVVGRLHIIPLGLEEKDMRLQQIYFVISPKYFVIVCHNNHFLIQQRVIALASDRNSGSRLPHRFKLVRHVLL